MSALPPRLGPYRVRSIVGVGGMGTVAAAVHDHLGRVVALKARAREALDDDEPLLYERFRVGARLQASLTHPHVAQVFDYFETDAYQVAVLELLEGGSVETLLEDGQALSVADAAQVALGAADALSYAHARGLVHRDIKPGNLLLRSARAPGTVQVTDFGVARALDTTSDLTVAGANVGTLWYMPPEQFNQEAPTPLVDVYALGATTYEMLTGHIPFREASHAELFRRFLDRQPPPPLRDRNPQVSALVAAVVEQALAVDVADRIPSVEVFATWLTAALAGSAARATLDEKLAEDAEAARLRAVEALGCLPRAHRGALSDALGVSGPRIAEQPTPVAPARVPASIDDDDDDDRTLVGAVLGEDD